MRIQGAFLTSRVGRRIFWTLLLAAAAPIAIFGAAMYELLSDQFQSQVVKQQVQLVKFAGMGLLDRLLVARTALTVVERTGRADLGGAPGSRSGRVLASVTQFDSDGNVLVGSGPAALRARDHALSWLSHRSVTAASLFVDNHRDTTPTPTVLILLGDEVLRDRVWVAEVDTEFLFGELSADAGGSRICVLDSQRRPVFCPDRAPNDGATNSSSNPDPVRWRLFLRSDFAVDDWTLESMDATPADGSALARLSALVAVLTLLFVGVLGLVQVRRTMVPLERLIAGTRRLAEGDYSARVKLRRSDEFGELACSFDSMAQRIDHQIKTMQVQASIDHEILHGLDVSRVLQRVAQRLEQLVPGSATCVVEFDQDSPLARLHRATAPLTIAAVSSTEALCIREMTTGETVPCDRPPSWLQAFLRSPAERLWLRCVRIGDQVMGLLVVGTADRSIEHAPIRSEIASLGDRVSVAFASADRERRLVERATRDSLTGLLNRAGLYESVDAMLSDDGKKPFSLMFLDLDRFKEINDSLGHQVGDEMLRAVASRLQQCVPQGTLVARPGGDEFVLVVRGPREAAEAMAASVCSALARPLDLDGRTAVIGASIGIAPCSDHGASARELMRRADLAMYSAKAAGGGTAAWFAPTMDAQVADRASMLADLRQAQAHGRLELHYQPRVDARDGAVRGAEALLRWQRPGHGFVPPAVFVKLLEETGLIERVGLWAIDEALGQLVRWRARGLVLESIAVNLSTRQLRANDLAGRVAQILARHRLRPSDLELEITESIFVDDATQSIATLQRLHDSGIRIALDDFGTGYSSLSYLHRLPIDVLKVDRSFVAEIGERDSALALTRSIVALARSLDLRVVAEGVETPRQEELLRALGCQELQGWLYAPALDPARFAVFIAQRVPVDAAAVG